MRTISLNTSSKKYAIKLGEGILKDAGALIRELDFAGKICVITDTNVEPLYGKVLKDSLNNTGYEVSFIVVPASEEYKTMETMLKIYNQLAEEGITRKDLIVALGGGVIGDMAGFAAATYLRGISYVQIPTTLLAQVDSSIGGKTGVDLKAGKNLVGAFKQPELVIADICLLETLPSEQIASGMAEVIKSGMIRDEELITLLENSTEMKKDLEEMILRSILVKKEVVEADEFETHERMLLNFGHTFGHAIEKIYHFTGITHGAAVAIGMSLITKDEKVKNRLKDLLVKYDLPIDTHLSMASIIDHARNDKKAGQSHINIVVVNRVGNGEIVKMDFETLRRTYG